MKPIHAVAVGFFAVVVGKIIRSALKQYAGLNL